MSAAKLGTLAARIVIQPRTHFGPQDAITGKIVLEYKPQTSLFKSSTATADLFAPVKLEVTLRGKVKKIVKQERDQPYDHGSLLFLVTFPLYDGPFKAQAGGSQEFTISVRFPSRVLGKAIPPTFSYYFAEFPDTVDLVVRYRAGIKLEVPGIDIKLAIPEHNNLPEIEYDLPHLPRASLNAEIGRISQKGAAAKIKAIFASPSIADVEIGCTKFQHVFPGFEPRFCIDVQGESLSDASLVSFRADLIAWTRCKTDKRLKGPYERSDRRTLQNLASRTSLPLRFSKENDHTVSLDAEAILGWTSTFRHAELSRTYTLRVKMKLKIAGHSVTFDKEFDIIMVRTAEMLPAYVVETSSCLPPSYG